MSKNSVTADQLSVPSYFTELVSRQDYPGLGSNSRVSLLSLINRLSPTVVINPKPSLHDFMHAEVSYIEDGLYVPKSAPIVDPKTDKERNLANILFTGAPYRPSVLPGQDKHKEQFGVAFQSAELIAVLRSPADLARATEIKTRDARSGNPDREEITEGAKRSSGHALETKIQSMTLVMENLRQDNNMYYHLFRHLISPGTVRVKSNKLEKYRAIADERVHDTVELSGVYMDRSSKDMAGAHRAVKQRIYTGNYSQAERSANIFEYLRMVASHNLAKQLKISLHLQKARAELAKYQPHLDAKANEAVQVA